jgi:peptidoglycan-associated lipoprotein
LDAVATYLKNTPNVQLVVEGHCDERGTEEYNRSLGERRAISAREYLLQKHGLSSERVTTVSFGEDKPVSNDKTEEGYARNRRGEFVLLR